MGHIINPISTRLGLNLFWNSNWTLNNKFNYSIMAKKNAFFFQFLTWILNSKKWKKKNIIFSHYIIYINNNNDVFFNIFFYWPFFEKNLLDNKNKRKFSKNKVKKNIQYSFIYQKLNMYLIKYMFAHLYWYFLKNIWIKYLNVYNSKYKYFFNIYNINFLNINANSIATYIGMRLIQKHRLTYTIKPVLRDLSIRLKQKKIKGFRILCTGRFTRRQIAERNWYSKGPVTNNHFSSFINYKQIQVRLKYGVCGIKVWINYGEKRNGILMQPYSLIFPHLKIFQSDTFLENYSLNFNLVSFMYLITRWNSIKMSYVQYYNFLHKKFFNLIYFKFQYFLYKEFSYLKFNKKITYNLRKLVKNLNYLQLIELISDSKNGGIKYFFKKPNKVFLYE